MTKREGERAKSKGKEQAGIDRIPFLQSWLVFSGTKEKLLKGKSDYASICSTAVLTRPAAAEEIVRNRRC
jgi:hypothetical protein